MCECLKLTKMRSYFIGGVFTKDQIESYIELKQEEQDCYRMTPHPVEFDMYYSC